MGKKNIKKGLNVMKILIATTSFGKEGREALALLQKRKLEIVQNPHGRKLEKEELILLAKGCKGIIAGTEKYSKDVLGALPELKAISRCGAGMDGIDFDAAKKSGVEVTNTPDAPADAVAELAVCLMLDALRKVSAMDRKTRQGQWKKEMGFLLKGKTVGIVGLGRIGKRVAQLLKPFGVKIVSFDLMPDKEFAKQNGIKIVSLDELACESDIITLHVPLAKEGGKIMDAKKIGMMKKNAVLINTSRGGLVDEKALYDALKGGKIWGAGLDVYEKEPYDGDLKELDNIILAPHVGAYAKEARERMELEAAQNLLKMLPK